MPCALDRLICASLPLLPAQLARRLLRKRHPFDLRHGTDTAGLLYAPDLPTGHAHDPFNEGYYATAPSVFRGLVSRWEDTLGAPGAGCPRSLAFGDLGSAISGAQVPSVGDRKSLRISDYHFVDLGCGKGRALLLASELPFRAITGVELHAGLCETARRNVDRWQKMHKADGRVSILNADALEALPAGLSPPGRPVVLFLFNSFGAEVMRPLLDQLTAAAAWRTAPIDLLYVHPDWAQMVESTPGVQTLFHGDIPFSREDALVDVFGVKADHCAIYRFGATQS